MKGNAEIHPYALGDMVGRPPTREAPLFGKKLAELRTRHGLTQAELALQLGVSQKTVTHYERRTANPSLELINRLASFFEVSPAELVGDDEPKARKGKAGPRSHLDELFDEVRALPRAEQQHIIKQLEDAVAGARRRAAAAE